jgi:hypothetical protein
VPETMCVDQHRLRPPRACAAAQPIAERLLRQPLLGDLEQQRRALGRQRRVLRVSTSAYSFPAAVVPVNPAAAASPSTSLTPASRSSSVHAPATATGVHRKSTSSATTRGSTAAGPDSPASTTADARRFEGGVRSTPASRSPSRTSRIVSSTESPRTTAAPGVPSLCPRATHPSDQTHPRADQHLPFRPSALDGLQ